MLGRPTGNSNTQDSPRPELGGGHHLPPYCIFCSSTWGPHPNGFLSPNSQVGAPKFQQLRLSQFWGRITSCANLGLRWGLEQSYSPSQELSNDMSHVACTQRNWVDSLLLVVRSQIANLIPDLSFGHNLCYRCSNGQCKPILDMYPSTTFQWYKELFKAMSFWPLQLRSKNSKVLLGLQLPTWEFTWECEGSFLHTLCTLGSMWSDSRVSLLARNLATPCLSHEPKATVVTFNNRNLISSLNIHPLLKCQKNNNIIFFFFFFFSTTKPTTKYMLSCYIICNFLACATFVTTNNVTQ